MKLENVSKENLIW